mmetsp:Transcript_9271/g.32678  ORF Transcript_9271/g.32678 Transcript_9271/m.32678 type:complete len:208 (+) Transcript_9271:3814-4437(+)
MVTTGASGRTTGSRCGCGRRRRATCNRHLGRHAHRAAFQDQLLHRREAVNAIRHEAENSWAVRHVARRVESLDEGDVRRAGNSARRDRSHQRRAVREHATRPLKLSMLHEGPYSLLDHQRAAEACRLEEIQHLLRNRHAWVVEQRVHHLSSFHRREPRKPKLVDVRSVQQTLQARGHRGLHHVAVELRRPTRDDELNRHGALVAHAC